MIREIKTFIDDATGKKVVGLMGEDVKYVGIAMMNLQVRNEIGQVMTTLHQEYEFKIEGAVDVPDAFAKFDASNTPEIQKKVQEGMARANGLAPATSPIIDPRNLPKLPHGANPFGKPIR